MHAGGEYRRRPRRLPVDHLLLQFELIALPDFARELGNIVHDVERAEIYRQPAPTFHVCDNPIDISLRISPLGLAFPVERGACSVVQITIGFKAIGLLKVANCIRKPIVKQPFVAGCFGSNLEPLAQKRNLVVFSAGFQSFAVRQLHQQGRVDRRFFLPLVCAPSAAPDEVFRNPHALD